MNVYKIHSHYGPGGRNCNCCGPSPKHRKAHDRAVKKRVKFFYEKEGENSLDELHDERLSDLDGCQ